LFDGGAINRSTSPLRLKPDDWAGLFGGDQIAARTEKAPNGETRHAKKSRNEMRHLATYEGDEGIGPPCEREGSIRHS
jgi:hypothetical protein